MPARNYAPLWITDGKANARATAAIAYLGHVDADGLDPADYPAPNFAAATTPADFADDEIKLTTAVFAYAHHASVGRVHWSRVSADTEYTTPAPEPGDVLNAMAGASDVAAALDAYEPKTPGYLRAQGQARRHPRRQGRQRRRGADRQRPGAQSRHAGRSRAGIAPTARPREPTTARPSTSRSPTR